MEETPGGATTNVTTKLVGSCENCGKEIDKSRIFWRRFCSDVCRTQYHFKARKIGQQVIKERANRG